MEKLNIAELLKNCPTGMGLDCMMFEDMCFDHISDCGKFIYCYINYEDRKTSISFNKYGAYSNIDKSKCVIFPKGKTTWEGFVPPCKFKDGDILATNLESVFILKEPNENVFYYSCYVALNDVSRFITSYTKFCIKNGCRLATEEEKQKLFDAITASGYKWNTETKTLEKLPIFKVGDRIKYKNDKRIAVITGIKNNCYFIQYFNTNKNDYQNESISIKDRDKYELVPNKFDINTLVPFESKVLVRHTETSIWMPAIFGGYDIPNLYYYVVGGTWWKYCIPYKGNEHLRGTTDECNDYYKTWKE